MLGHRHDYSWSETALSFWATLTLSVLSVTSLVLRYVTSPMTCLPPQQFGASETDYLLKTCFHQNYIYSPQTFINPDDDDRFRFTYHQWLPFFLGVAATLCLLPHVVWRVLSTFLWLDLHEMVRALKENQERNAGSRHAMLHDYAILLETGLKGGNSVLTMASLGRKALACAVCFIQLLLMVLVFAPDLSVAERAVGVGEEGGGNGSIGLPLEPFACEFAVRKPGSANSFVVSALCFMPLAQTYNKGLIFLFYLFLLLFVLSALDMGLWAGRLLAPGFKDVTFQRYLDLFNQSESDSQSPGPAHIARFLDHVGADGRLLLALIADHCGSLAAADLCNHLLKVFKDAPRPCPALSASCGATAVSSSAASAPPAAGGGEPGEDADAIPMIAVTDQDGNTPGDAEEKAKSC